MSPAMKPGQSCGLIQAHLCYSGWLFLGVGPQGVEWGKGVVERGEVGVVRKLRPRVLCMAPGVGPQGGTSSTLRCSDGSHSPWDKTPGHYQWLLEIHTTNHHRLRTYRPLQLLAAAWLAGLC